MINLYEGQLGEEINERQTPLGVHCKGQVRNDKDSTK